MEEQLETFLANLKSNFSSGFKTNKQRIIRLKTKKFSFLNGFRNLKSQELLQVKKQNLKYCRFIAGKPHI